MSAGTSSPRKLQELDLELEQQLQVLATTSAASDLASFKDFSAIAEHLTMCVTKWQPRFMAGILSSFWAHPITAELLLYQLKVEDTRFGELQGERTQQSTG
jgi:cytochrome bd-type quinol oxidase subunit 1